MQCGPSLQKWAKRGSGHLPANLPDKRHCENNGTNSQREDLNSPKEMQDYDVVYNSATDIYK